MNLLIDFCLNGFKEAKNTDKSSPKQKSYVCCANFCCNSFKTVHSEWTTQLSINNKIHVFCCTDCKFEFLSNPSQIGSYSPPPPHQTKTENEKTLPALHLDT
jgi:hypothetical protein